MARAQWIFKTTLNSFLELQHFLLNIRHSISTASGFGLTGKSTTATMDTESVFLATICRIRFPRSLAESWTWNSKSQTRMHLSIPIVLFDDLLIFIGEARSFLPDYINTEPNREVLLAESGVVLVSDLTPTLSSATSIQELTHRSAFRGLCIAVIQLYTYPEAPLTLRYSSSMLHDGEHYHQYQHNKCSPESVHLYIYSCLPFNNRCVVPCCPYLQYCFFLFRH